MREFIDTYWPFQTRQVTDSIFLAAFSFDPDCELPMLELSQDECIGDHTVAPIFFKPTFRPVEYENNEEFQEDGFGGEKLILRRVERIYPVVTYCDKSFLKYFYEMIYSSDQMNLRIVDSSPPANDTILIYSVSIKESEIGENLFEITITYKTKDLQQHGPFGIKSCCNPLYEEAPYEDPCAEGGTGGGTGGGGSTPDCADAVVTVSRSGNDLNASVTGYSGSYHFNWLYKENPGDPWITIIQNASSVQLSDPGTYRAVLIASGCQDKHDQYSYLGVCHGIGVLLREDNGAIIADPSGGCPNGTFDFFIYDEVTEEFDTLTHDGSATYVPSEDGLYKVSYSCSQNGEICTAEDVILFQFDPECDPLDIEIVQDGDDLVPTGITEPVDSYQWKYNNGGNEVVIGTSETVAYQGQGLYLLHVMIGECSYNVVKLILEDCDPCEGTTAEILMDEDDLLQVEVQGCDEDLAVEWYRNKGEGYVQVGSGVELDPTQHALYRADINCGDCFIQTYYLHCDGEGGPVEGGLEAHVQFLPEGGITDTVDLPEPYEEIVAVFKDNLNLVEGATFLGYSITPTGIVLSEPVNTNNQSGGETIRILWRPGNVLVYVEFMTSGTLVNLPSPFSEIQSVFKDNLVLVEGASTLGYTITTTGIELSEPVDNNNPAGGETIKILWKE